jgi:hypothetical protein
MSNVNSVNLALAILTSQNQAEQHILEEIAKLKAENAALALTASKTKAVKKAKPSGAQVAPPTHGKNTVCGLLLPDPTYSDNLPHSAQVECAKTFLSAMRNAGKRMVAEGEGEAALFPKLVFQERNVRNDQIQAISAFIGYDNREMFGTQETAARMLAMRILNPKHMMGPDRETQKTADHSAKGFIAGLPSPVKSLVNDREARIVIAVETMTLHMRDADDTSRSESDRELSAALALVEQERVSAIRAEIASMTF